MLTPVIRGMFELLEEDDSATFFEERLEPGRELAMSSNTQALLTTFSPAGHD
jgi:hypothetical protein